MKPDRHLEQPEVEKIPSAKEENQKHEAFELAATSLHDLYSRADNEQAKVIFDSLCHEARRSANFHFGRYTVLKDLGY